MLNIDVRVDLQSIKRSLIPLQEDQRENIYFMVEFAQCNYKIASRNKSYQ